MQKHRPRSTWQHTWIATKRLLRSRLALRMITVFLLGGALPLLLFGTLAYVQVSSELESQTQRRLHQETKAVAMGIIERLLFLEAGLDLLLEHASDELDAPLRPGLARLLDSQFQDLGIHDGEDRLLWGSPPALSTEAIRERPVGERGSFLWITDTESPSPARSSPEGESPEHSFPTVLMVRRSGDGERWAWGNIDPTYLWDLGPRGSLPYQMELAVVGTGGRFLVRSAHIPDALASRLTQAAAEQRATRNLEWSAERGRHHGSFWAIPMTVNYRTEPWVVALGIESAAAQAALARWRAVFPLSLLLTLWVVLLLVVVQVRRSLDPLSALQRAVRRVGEGDFSPRVDLATGDEFEDLAQGFNRTAERLGSQFETLSAITRLGRTAMAQKDDRELLTAVLGSLHAAVGARQAAVVLTGHDALHAGRSTSGEEPRIERLPYAELPGAEEEEDLWRAILDERLPRSDRTIPLVVDGRRLGLLAVGGTGSTGGDSLEELAEQIALVWRHRLLAEELDRERTGLEELVERLPHGVIVLDAQRRIVLANLLARNYLQDLSDAVPGRRLTHLGPMALEAPAAGESVRWSDLRLPEPFRRIFVVAFAGMGPDRSVVLLRDVTQEREMQDELGRQERLAAVGQLAAGMAHDLNNTLQVVLSTTEMIRAQSLSAVVREHADRVLERSRHGSALIRQMLDFSRRSPQQPEALSINRLVEDHVALLRHLLPQGVTLSAEIPTEPMVLLADITQIQQVLTNLILNARDAIGDKGKIHLTLKPLDPPVGTDAPGRVELVVHDDGPGIPEDIQSRVFEPFFTTKELGRGSGLGLAQVYGIIESHGGTVHLESSPARGTRFCIVLPRSGASIPEKAVAESSASRAEGQRILVVEDQEVVRIVLCLHLETLGYRVEAAVDGPEALDKMETIGETVDLVISDFSMPKMNGKKLAALLHRSYPRLPIVLLTGYAEEDGPALARLPGVTDLLQKPVTVEALSKAVERALSGSVD